MEIFINWKLSIFMLLVLIEGLVSGKMQFQLHYLDFKASFDISI